MQTEKILKMFSEFRFGGKELFRVSALEDATMKLWKIETSRNVAAFVEIFSASQSTVVKIFLPFKSICFSVPSRIGEFQFLGYQSCNSQKCGDIDAAEYGYKNDDGEKFAIAIRKGKGKVYQYIFGSCAEP